MLKLRAFCLFLLSTMIYVSDVQAKVCFLPGILSGDGCLDNLKFGCHDFKSTKECISGYIQSSCTTTDGMTYYNCECDVANNYTASNGLGTTYKCANAYDESCGCSRSDTYCNENEYPYSSCEQFDYTDVSSEYCQNPADGVRKYKSCDCSPSVFPFTCTEQGLKKPTFYVPKCVGSDGVERYTTCDCANSWTSGLCGDNEDGCTRQRARVDLGNGIYCSLCGMEPCENPADIDLYVVYDPIYLPINVDCESLGYVYSETGVCEDGKPSLKCAYNKKYIYCEEKPGCQYDEEESCTTANPNSNCEENADKCYVPTACKDDYARSCSSGYYVSDPDIYGCGTCVTDCYFTDKSACEELYEGYQCVVDLSGCYTPDLTSSAYSFACAIGDIYYSDRTCSSVDDYKPLNHKKPIGVVYALSAEEGGVPYRTNEALNTKSLYGRIINLHDIKFDAINYHQISSEYPYEGSCTYFGLDGVDVPQAAYTSIADAFIEREQGLYNGLFNTNNFAAAKVNHAQCLDGTYQVGEAPIGAYAQYCQPTVVMNVQNFYPPEVSADDVVAGAGKWYVPSLGELVMLYGVDEANVSDRVCEFGATGETINKVNYTLEKLSSKQASWKMANGFSGQVASKLNKYYWSSTQYNKDRQWIVSMDNGCRFARDRRCGNQPIGNAYGGEDKFCFWSIYGEVGTRATLMFSNTFNNKTE